MKKAKIVAIANQKGGTAKTTTTINLGAALTRKGYRVLLIDLDSQGSLSISLGIDNPDCISKTICSIFENVIQEKEYDHAEYVIKHQEGFDFIPANIELAAMDVYLVNVLGRERILQECLEPFCSQYDYILIDCMPSLGMLTINALTAANSIIIPVQAAYLPAKGLEQLLKSVSKIRRQLNPNLKIDGILITLVNQRTNYAKDIISLLRESYGEHLNIFHSMIPLSVRATETSASGVSIFNYDPKGIIAQKYATLCEEVISCE